MTTVSASVAKLCSNCDKNHKPYFCCKCLRAGHTYHKCSVGNVPSTCYICGSSTHTNYNCPCRHSRLMHDKKKYQKVSNSENSVPDITDMSLFPVLQ